MPRRVRTHTGRLSGNSDNPLTPKHLTKQQFAKRIYDLMAARGWNQSELGRRAGLPRDNISTYMRGRSLPTPTRLKALADAFGLQPEDLLPNIAESAIDEDHPEFEFRVSPNAPDTAWIRVNRLVTLHTAIQIASLLENDHAATYRVGDGECPPMQSSEN